MDPRYPYPTHEESSGSGGSSRRRRQAQFDAQGEAWEEGADHQSSGSYESTYEQHPPTDRRSDYYHSGYQYSYQPSTDRILPPGSLSGFYNQASYRNPESYPSTSRQHSSYDLGYRPYEQEGADSRPQHEFYPDPYSGGAPSAQQIYKAKPEKKYLCRLPPCGRSTEGNGFTTMNDLERHERSIHKGAGHYTMCREPGCPEGRKPFPRKDNFIDHWRRCHGPAAGLNKQQAKARAGELAREWEFLKTDGWPEQQNEQNPNPN